MQAVINCYVNDGKPRTAVKLFQALKAIFNFAIGDEIIEKSPMRLMKPPIYEEKSGCALTVEEERELVSVWAGHAADETQTTKVNTKFPREFMLQEG